MAQLSPSLFHFLFSFSSHCCFFSGNPHKVCVIPSLSPSCCSYPSLSYIFLCSFDFCLCSFISKSQIVGLSKQLSPSSCLLVWPLSLGAHYFSPPIFQQFWGHFPKTINFLIQQDPNPIKTKSYYGGENGKFRFLGLTRASRTTGARGVNDFHVIEVYSNNR